MRKVIRHSCSSAIVKLFDVVGSVGQEHEWSGVSSQCEYSYVIGKRENPMIASTNLLHRLACSRMFGHTPVNTSIRIV